jgi:hypothetical protein
MTTAHLSHLPQQISLPRQPFQHGHFDGECFIRAHISAQRLLILCAQLSHYNGPSVTNAVETIVASTLQTLAEKGALDHFAPARKAWAFWRPRRELASLAQAALSRLTWVEHYSAKTSISSEPTWAVVHSPVQAPQWSYVNVDALSTDLAADKRFFLVDPDLLYSGN